MTERDADPRPKMTKAALLEILAECKRMAADEDVEEAHLKADYALIDFIDDDDVRRAYNVIEPMWYA